MSVEVGLSIAIYPVKVKSISPLFSLTMKITKDFVEENKLIF